MRLNIGALLNVPIVGFKVVQCAFRIFSAERENEAKNL
jgi:hypothetical protein